MEITPSATKTVEHYRIAVAIELDVQAEDENDARNIAEAAMRIATARSANPIQVTTCDGYQRSVKVLNLSEINRAIGNFSLTLNFNP